MCIGPLIISYNKCVRPTHITYYKRINTRINTCQRSTCKHYSITATVNNGKEQNIEKKARKTQI